MVVSLPRSESYQLSVNSLWQENMLFPSQQTS